MTLELQIFLTTLIAIKSLREVAAVGLLGNQLERWGVLAGAMLITVPFQALWLLWSVYG